MGEAWEKMGCGHQGNLCDVDEAVDPPYGSTHTNALCRVYYLPLSMLHLATSVARPNLVSLGTCFGKFSKTGKFKLGITSLDWLAKYAKYKVSLRPVEGAA